MKKFQIMTNYEELYTKFPELNYQTVIYLSKNIHLFFIQKIVDRINKQKPILSLEQTPEGYKITRLDMDCQFHTNRTRRR